MRVIVILFFVVVCLPASTSAQMYPSAPNAPTNAKACQAFKAQVDAYVAAYSKEHELCLAANRADRPQETRDSLICSRSRCQSLHDIVYGNTAGSAKYLRQQVQSCY